MLSFVPIALEERRVQEVELPARPRELHRLVRSARRRNDLPAYHLQPLACGAELQRLIRIVDPFADVRRQRRSLGRRLGPQDEPPPPPLPLAFLPHLPPLPP